MLLSAVVVMTTSSSGSSAVRQDIFFSTRSLTLFLQYPSVDSCLPSTFNLAVTKVEAPHSRALSVGLDVSSSSHALGK